MLSTILYVPRQNWDSPTPSLASECALLPEPKGGGGKEGLGESQFRRVEKSLACCLLCDTVIFRSPVHN